MPFFKTNRGDSRAMILLAPSGACLKPFSGQITCSARIHNDLTNQLQRMRGSVYLEDSAIQASDLTACGRHVSSQDEQSWHLLTLGTNGAVQGCTRMHRHKKSVGYHDLGVSSSPLSDCPAWGTRFRDSVKKELDDARNNGFSYFEIGGWALAPEVRGTAEALKSVLSIFALGGIGGEAFGISTATERNSSASILRRLGGRPLESNGDPVPPYYDEKYRCGMEVLRFDSRFPNPRYAAAIGELRARISRVPVIVPESAPGRVNPAFSFVPSFAAPSFA